MSTDVAEPQGRTGRTSSRDREGLVHHYVPKDALLDSIVNGVRVTALCGTRFRASVSPQMAGTSSRPARRCPDCLTAAAYLRDARRAGS